MGGPGEISLPATNGAQDGKKCANQKMIMMNSSSSQGITSVEPPLK